MPTTTSSGAKKINNNDNWREIFDCHNDTCDAIDTLNSKIYPVIIDGNISSFDSLTNIGLHIGAINPTYNNIDGYYCFTLQNGSEGAIKQFITSRYATLNGIYLRTRTISGVWTDAGSISTNSTVTLTPDTTKITARNSSSISCIKNGKTVTISMDFQTNSSISAYTTIISGCPTPANGGNTVYGVLNNRSNGSTRSFYIDGLGKLNVLDTALESGVYYSGTITYICL